MGEREEEEGLRNTQSPVIRHILAAHIVSPLEGLFGFVVGPLRGGIAAAWVFFNNIRVTC